MLDLAAKEAIIEELTSWEVAALDPYKFMAVIGTRVIQDFLLMPRMAKPVPYLGYVLDTGHKPAEVGES